MDSSYPSQDGGISQDELYEKADWKATMELRTMIESNTAEGEGCSGCDGYSEDARVTVDTGLVSNAQWKLLIVSDDVTSVRVVSMNATVVVTVTMD